MSAAGRTEYSWPMQARYRKLTSNLDPNAVRDAFADNLNSAKAIELGLGGAALDAALNAPREVKAEEHEASLEEIGALFAQGELAETDLINVGRGWQTLGDCPELDDVAEEGRRKGQ